MARRLAVLAAFGLTVYGAVRIVTTVTDDRTVAGGDPATTAVPSAPAAAPAAPVGGAAAAAAPTSTVAPTTTAPAVDTGPPSPDDPARVLIVGDSDAGTFGPYLERLLDDNDDVGDITEVTLDYVVSSGLSRPDFHDWPAHLREALAAIDPDIVIVTFGGNDAQGLSEPCPNGAGTCEPRWLVGHPIGNEAEWTAEYERRVKDAVEMMLAGDRRVIWVGIPNAASAELTQRLEIQDQAVRAALEGVDGVTFVDTWDMFDGGNGGYAEYVPDPRDGQAKIIRASDGFHLNETGAEILALAIFRQVESVLRDLGADV